MNLETVKPWLSLFYFDLLKINDILLDMKFLKLLQKLAKSSTHHQHKMSCIIAKKNRIISMGFNKVKTCPRINTRFNMIHAEIDALLGNSYEDLKGCTAYVYRAHKDGSLAMSLPCPACMAALVESGIKKIIYSVENDFKEMNL